MMTPFDFAVFRHIYRTTSNSALPSRLIPVFAITFSTRRISLRRPDMQLIVVPIAVAISFAVIGRSLSKPSITAYDARFDSIDGFAACDSGLLRCRFSQISNNGKFIALFPNPILVAVFRPEPQSTTQVASKPCLRIYCFCNAFQDGQLAR
jgi:hypothetical protein